MHVILPARRGQQIATLTLAAWLVGGVVSAETHANLQAVTSAGTSAWAGGAPFTLTGVLLTDPTEMLDPAPHFIPWDGGAGQYQLGAEWQVVLQATEPGDRGGTACYLGQCYGNMPFNHSDVLSYSNAAWTAEVLRLSFDPETMHPFRAGDLVQVTANSCAFYGGKLNVNETHHINPAYDFTISLVTSNYGLPEAEVLTLADLKQADDAYIFDQTRATGGEHWQGMRVRINNLSLLTTSGWNPTNTWGNRKCTATDTTGRTFPLRTPRYSLGPVPAGMFDALGVLNQESGSGSQGTNGYELFVQQVIPQVEPALAIAQKIALTWPAGGANYQLEYRDDLNSTNWSAYTNSVPAVVDGQTTVLVPPAANTQQYYRLRKTN